MSNKRRRKSTATRTKAKPQGTQSSAGGSLGKWAAIIGTVVVVVGVTALIVTGLEGGGSSSSEPPQGTRQVAVGPGTHIEGPIAYDSVVPAGGPHNSIWINCGFYPGQIPRENVVHALEHGAVWITYQPTIDEETRDRLRDVARGRRKVVVSEVAEQTPLLMATAWGWQLDLTTVDDPRLDQFLNEFESSFNAPEPGGLCVGGVGQPEG